MRSHEQLLRDSLQRLIEDNKNLKLLLKEALYELGLPSKSETRVQIIAAIEEALSLNRL